MYGMSSDLLRVVTIYSRCRRYKIAPGPGSMAAQSERLMAFLDVIHAEVKAHEREMMKGGK